jgi:hypothetical protein
MPERMLGSVGDERTPEPENAPRIEARVGSAGPARAPRADLDGNEDAARIDRDDVDLAEAACAGALRDDAPAEAMQPRDRCGLGREPEVMSRISHRAPMMRRAR